MPFNLDIDNNLDTRFTTDNDVILGDLDLDDSISLELSNNIDDYINRLDDSKNITPNRINSFRLSRDLKKISLSDNALLCGKILVSPIAVFFHVGRFVFPSVSSIFSFGIALAISDIIFFYVLDKFILSYARYFILAITGIVALSSIKGVITAFVDLFLSLFKGIYSWYFSLINKDCSFKDFLFGKNIITKK